jgi:hypothetical protein
MRKSVTMASNEVWTGFILWHKIKRTSTSATGLRDQGCDCKTVFFFFFF